MTLSTRFYDEPESRGNRLPKEEVQRRCPRMKVGYPDLNAKIEVHEDDFTDRFGDRILAPQNPFNSDFFNDRVIGLTSIGHEHLSRRGIGQGEFALRSLVIVNDKIVPHVVQIGLERRFDLEISMPESTYSENILLQNFHYMAPREFADTLVRFRDTELSSWREFLSVLGAFFVGLSLSVFGGLLLKRITR